MSPWRIQNDEGLLAATPADGRVEEVEQALERVGDSLAPPELLPESSVARIRESLDGLTDAELEWVVLRSQVSTDREVAKRLGRKPNNPIPAGQWGGDTPKTSYSASRMAYLRQKAKEIRAERGVVAMALIERLVLGAVLTIGELSEQGPPKVRLDASRDILDRYLGKPGTKESSAVDTLEAVTELVRTLKQDLRSAEEVDAEHRAVPSDYDDAEEADYRELPAEDAS